MRLPACGLRLRFDEQRQAVEGDHTDGVTDVGALLAARSPDLPVEPDLAGGAARPDHDPIATDHRLRTDDVPSMPDSPVPREELRDPDRDEHEKGDEVPRPGKDEEERDGEDDQHRRLSSRLRERVRRVAVAEARPGGTGRREPTEERSD